MFAYTLERECYLQLEDGLIELRKGYLSDGKKSHQEDLGGLFPFQVI